MYCIYKKRLPGDLNYNAAFEGAYMTYKNVTDCPNIVV